MTTPVGSSTYSGALYRSKNSPSLPSAVLSMKTDDLPSLHSVQRAGPDLTRLLREAGTDLAVHADVHVLQRAERMDTPTRMLLLFENSNSWAASF